MSWKLQGLLTLVKILGVGDFINVVAWVLHLVTRILIVT
jgi:hypothetical protein